MRIEAKSTNFTLMLRFTWIPVNDDDCHHIDHHDDELDDDDDDDVEMSSDSVGISLVAKVNGDLHCWRQL